MDERKSLLVDLAETIDRHLPHRTSPTEHASPKSRNWLHWLGKQLVPNLGSVIIVLILLYTFPGLAAPNQSPAATSISTIPYQGRLADSGGTPVTAMQNMEFRIYDVPTGGTPLWEELWTGGNSVSVSDGLFSVLLGSLEPGIATVVQSHDELYLGVTVGTDSEMSPRVQLGSVPFSMQALTVPDGSITTEKIADGAVTQAKLSTDIPQTLIQSGGSYADVSTPGWTLYEGTGYRAYTQTVTFTHSFVGTPRVVANLGHIHVDRTTNPLIGVTAENITQNGFDLVFYTWNDAKVFGAVARWIAFTSQ